MKHISLSFIWLITFLSMAHANENCTDILRLSSTETYTLENEDTYFEEVNDFCKEASSYMNSGRNSNFGMKYEALGIDTSSQKKHVSKAYNKHCQSNKAKYEKSTAYKKYIKNIAPQAYSTYQTCLEYNSKHLFVHASPQNFFSNEARFYITNKGGGRTHEMKVSFRTTNAKCTFDSAEFSSLEDVELKPNEQMPVSCKRDDASKRASIDVFSSDSSQRPISLTWSAYTKKSGGYPVNLIDSLQRQIKYLKNKNEDLDNQNSNAFKEIKKINDWIHKTRSPNVQHAYELPGGAPWGHWKGAQHCPKNFYVCGLEQSVEPSRGRDDDTGVNTIRMYCCPL